MKKKKISAQLKYDHIHGMNIKWREIFGGELIKSQLNAIPESTVFQLHLKPEFPQSEFSQQKVAFLWQKKPTFFHLPSWMTVDGESKERLFVSSHLIAVTAIEFNE